MELALSLGDTPKPFSFLEKSPKILGFCMAAGADVSNGGARAASSDPPVQLELLPFSPVQKTPPNSVNRTVPFPWLNQKLGGAGDSRLGLPPESNDGGGDDHEGAGGGASATSLNSSPNSVMSSAPFPIDLTMFRSSSSSSKRDFEHLAGGEASDDHRSSRGSDEEENGAGGRKKLRLSKEQSAFLEESFKEHHTLNPKQKIALAKQLSLRPRQVEVWFQNRRARTKLKQTEVDCEYLKRWCETLTEENKRLHKELQELRALKASQPFYKQLPPTTLTMCPSCERVATSGAGTGPSPAAQNKSAAN